MIEVDNKNLACDMQAKFLCLLGNNNFQTNIKRQRGNVLVRMKLTMSFTLGTGVVPSQNTFLVLTVN